MATVHLAGTPVSVAGRIIQRCLICGEKLADNQHCAMPTNPDGSYPVFPTWGVGDWIKFEGNHWSRIGETDAPLILAEDVPAGCCIDLVER